MQNLKIPEYGENTTQSWNKMMQLELPTHSVLVDPNNSAPSPLNNGTVLMNCYAYHASNKHRSITFAKRLDLFSPLSLPPPATFSPEEVGVHTVHADFRTVSFYINIVINSS